MSQKDRIRNVGIIAHIDHGKTTMADSLLVQAGLLPAEIAGQARALDYLEQEQIRGITIKTANISLLHKTEKGPFVINVVDTPGHVDFAGKVARAMRAVDGAIIIVDAVEGVMTQTETVTRQALMENVKPVLFINKVDRLFEELELTLDEIQSKFKRIIDEINNLIEQYAEARFKKEWQLNANTSTVAFGSALHKWGFTRGQIMEKQITFSDVAHAYQDQELSRLSKLLPLHQAILTMVVHHLPSPFDAQKYRIARIWKGNLKSELGQALLDCDKDGPLTICLTNVQLDQKDSAVATGRVFSGTVRPRTRIFLCTSEKEQMIAETSIYMGNHRENAAGVEAGNIVALTGLETTQTGETITDIQHREEMIPFESFTYISEPVMTVTVEPKNPKDLPLVIDALHRLAGEDPNLRVALNERTGEYRLSGIGELHLETSLEFLRNYSDNADIVSSLPTVDYREGMIKKGTPITAVSSNKKNAVTVQAEPIIDTKTPLVQSILATEASNVLIAEKEASIPAYARQALVEGFRWACKSGPLCEEPLRNIKAILLQMKITHSLNLQDLAQIARTTSRAMLGSFLSGKPVLHEPIYKTEISVPVDHMGAAIEVLTKRHAKIFSAVQEGSSTVIKAFISVEKTFGLSQELMSATSGRAFWESSFDHWQPIPQNMQAVKIAEIRSRRGLPVEIPRPQKFAGEFQGESET